MVEEKLMEAVRTALEDARNAGEISLPEIPALALETPPEKAFGDFSSNAALVLARSAKRAPRDIAAILQARLMAAAGSLLERVEVAGPGFLNFFLKPDWLYDVLRRIELEKEQYGCSNLGGRQRVLLEFVSANPTGPIGVVQGRSGAYGDVLGNLLAAVGYEVSREFYVNDWGNQVRVLGKSLEVRYRQHLGESVPLPEECYQGAYLIDIARSVPEADGSCYLALPEEERTAAFRDLAIARILEQQKQTMDAFGVHFDRWYSDRMLHETGRVNAGLKALTELGHTYESEGALWLRSTAFGDDRDRVLVRSNGMPTYLAGDTAYHLDKFQRGFDLAIDIWGPDHHGYITRTQATVKALGYGGRLEILIHQIVRLFSGGEMVRMSKRAGDIIELDELLEEVGRDAARFFFLMRSADSPLDFDLDLAKKESSENPVYYVQYAHARICSILRGGSEAAGSAVPVPRADEADISRLTHEMEKDLIRKLADFPGEVRAAALAREPHRIARYAQELAQAFHLFYRDCRVLCDDPELSRARLVLVNGARIVLRNTLDLLGISAPERM